MQPGNWPDGHRPLVDARGNVVGIVAAKLDASAALAYPGVHKVVPISSGIAVIADNTWVAFHARKLLKVTYAPGPNHDVSTASIYAEGHALVQTPGLTLKDSGDTNAALQSGTVVRATYETPYLAHATMEPMNATADVRPDGVTLWLPTQCQTPTQQMAAVTFPIASSNRCGKCSTSPARL